MWRSIVCNLDSEWDCTKFWCCGYTAELLSLSLSLPRLLTCKTGSLSTQNPSRDRCTNHRYYLGRCLPVVTTPPDAMSWCCYHRNEGRKLAISLTVYEFLWNVFKTPWAISYLFYSLKLWLISKVSFNTKNTKRAGFSSQTYAFQAETKLFLNYLKFR